MSDARWFEVDADVESAVGHFRRAIALFEKGGFDNAGLDGYQASMALMHALQSAHTSLEAALLRVLDAWRGAAGRRRLAYGIDSARCCYLPGRRTAILGSHLAVAADETRRFRHRATHNYDRFRISEITRTIDAAEVLGRDLRAAFVSFRNSIDPPAGGAETG